MRNTYSRFVKRLDQFVRSGMFAAFLAISGVISGAIVSLYSTDIKQGWSGLVSGAFPVNQAFWSFAAICLMFFLSVGVREWRIGFVSAAYQRQLIETVRTMPPQNLLNIYSGIYIEVSTHVHEYVNVIDDNDPDKLGRVEAAIRITLDGMCTLIAAFENYPDGAVYSANVMEFLCADTLRADAKLSKQVLERLRFVETKTLDGLAGVLDLQLALSSTSAQSDSSAADKTLAPLALPLPRQESEVSGKTRLLPGAPMAFNGPPCLLEDSTKIAALASERCDVSPGVVKEIENYFHEHASKTIGSILSVRVNRQVAQCGIINIHCDRPNVLYDEKQLYTYINLINPFLDVIYRLLLQRSKLKG